MLDAMKTLTTREFYHSPGLAKSLKPGQSFIVTDNGKPSLIVTKAGKRPRKTREDLDREAQEICPDEKPKVNFTKWLKEHRSR
jgi:hypothetical protein